MTDLHICPECDSTLVYPTLWHRHAYRRWWIERRCPNCEWTSEGVHSEYEVGEFDEILDAGVALLEDSFQWLRELNFKEEIKMFALALRHDALLPEDFGRI